MRGLLRALIVIAGIALVVAAIRQEMRKPKEERNWCGKLAGVIPYEFRPPTPRRIKDAVWNPNDERLFTDTAFGVGWSVNLAQLKDKLARRTNGAVA